MPETERTPFRQDDRTKPLATPKVPSLPGSDLKIGPRAAHPTPFVLENPDGSLSLGLPAGLTLPSPPPSPRPFPSSGVRLPQSREDVIELERKYRRHLRLFEGLLFAELFVDLVFSAVYASRSEFSIHEVSLVCRTVPMAMLHRIFWGLFAIEVTYLKVYYALAVLAVYKSKRRSYSWFTNTAMFGIVGQVLFAYMNKFNILVFVLRLCSYIYAKFLRKLLERGGHLPLMWRQV